MVHWELIIAVSGILIALATAITTIWQGFLTRKHNRLSLKPLLEIERKAIIGEKASVVLKNKGIGPAIIKSALLYIDGIESTNRSDDDLAGQLGLTSPGINRHVLDPDDTLGSGEERYLIETQTSITDDNLRKQIENIFFHRLSFQIQFETLYDEKFLFSGNPRVAP